MSRYDCPEINVFSVFAETQCHPEDFSKALGEQQHFSPTVTLK